VKVLGYSPFLVKTVFQYFNVILFIHRSAVIGTASLLFLSTLCISRGVVGTPVGVVKIF
jgi:hypothetical protein